MFSLCWCVSSVYVSSMCVIDCAQLYVCLCVSSMCVDVYLVCMYLVCVCLIVFSCMSVCVCV